MSYDATYGTKDPKGLIPKKAWILIRSWTLPFTMMDGSKKNFPIAEFRAARGDIKKHVGSGTAFHKGFEIDADKGIKKVQILSIIGNDLYICINDEYVMVKKAHKMLPILSHATIENGVIQNNVAVISDGKGYNLACTDGPFYKALEKKKSRKIISVKDADVGGIYKGGDKQGYILYLGKLPTLSIKFKHPNISFGDTQLHAVVTDESHVWLQSSDTYHKHWIHDVDDFRQLILDHTFGSMEKSLNNPDLVNLSKCIKQQNTKRLYEKVGQLTNQELQRIALTFSKSRIELMHCSILERLRTHVLPDGYNITEPYTTGTLEHTMSEFINIYFNFPMIPNPITKSFDISEIIAPLMPPGIKWNFSEQEPPESIEKICELFKTNELIIK